MSKHNVGRSNVLSATFDRLKCWHLTIRGSKPDLGDGSFQTVHSTENGTQSKETHMYKIRILFQPECLNQVILPTKALWNLTTSIHRKQKRGVSVFAGTVQKFLHSPHAVIATGLGVSHRNCLLHIVHQLRSQAHIGQILGKRLVGVLAPIVRIDGEVNAAKCVLHQQPTLNVGHLGAGEHIRSCAWYLQQTFVDGGEDTVDGAEFGVAADVWGDQQLDEFAACK